MHRIFPTQHTAIRDDLLLNSHSSFSRLYTYAHTYYSYGHRNDRSNNIQNYFPTPYGRRTFIHVREECGGKRRITIAVAASLLLYIGPGLLRVLCCSYNLHKLYTTCRLTRRRKAGHFKHADPPSSTQIQT